MHYNYILHYVIFGSSMHMLDHAEPESEVQAERAQVEASTNLELDQGKPRCIPPNIP
jgi:hypothetical protein